MNSHGLAGAEMAAAVVSALGIFVTVLMLPETKGKSLEELTRRLNRAPANVKRRW
jgi:MFS transporter, PHS family, inorganic phosphate transporter